MSLRSAAHAATARVSSSSSRAARAVARVRRMRTGVLAPWTVPGAARFYELRWALMLRRTPAITPATHAARTAVRDIEEMIACDLCGQGRFQPLFHAYAGKRRQHRYHVVRCPECGFLYRQPGIKPERLGELYSSGKYGSFLTGGYARKRQRRYQLVMDAFTPLFDDGGGRRLLDFGCGAGLFLEVAHERGFACHGVDLSADSIERAREHAWGANAHHGAPGDVPEIAAGGFDVITLWSVLAHLATPVADFRMLRGLLAPDGVLLVLTVNANSLFLKARREHWNGFTPNHLKFFSPTTLPRLLGQAGFAAVTMPPMAPDSVVSGRARLSLGERRRLYRTVERGNTGNMLRAVAFNDAATPERYGIVEQTQALPAS